MQYCQGAVAESRRSTVVLRFGIGCVIGEAVNAEGRGAGTLMGSPLLSAAWRYPGLWVAEVRPVGSGDGGLEGALMCGKRG